MTEKQRKCIEWICNILNVKYYGKNTVQDASNFISKFIGRAEEVQRESNFCCTWGISYILGKAL